MPVLHTLLALIVVTATPAAPPPSEADLASYRAHLETLASPLLEGRGPGSAGNRTAAEYFEHQFRELGLKPAFDSGHRPGNEAESPSFFQQFTAGREVRVREASVSFVPVGEGIDPRIERQTLVLGKDYNVLGNSGSAEVEGQIAFVGYSLEPADGPGAPKPDDASFVATDDLTGKIAFMFRFEPLNSDGKSRLTEKGEWSPASAISQKIMAAVNRHAAAIILVSPPGADDRRAFNLETPESSAAWTRALSIPVVMLTSAAAERLVKAADGRSLFEMRKLADKARTGLAETDSAVVTLPRANVRISTSTDRFDRITWNVGGILPGSGELASQFIVVGGHFDHVGRGYQGGSRSGEYGEIHPGADDNASGASGVLLAAEILSRRYASDAPAPGSAGMLPSRRSILFLGFSAEEMGLIGSREFVKASPIDAKAISIMLNMDMIGRVRDEKLVLAGTGTAEGLAGLIQPSLDASGFTIEAQPGGRGPSDHATFYGAGIPVLHFFTGLHEEYHTPRDTADLINVNDAVRVVHLVTDLAESFATRTEQLSFTSTDRGARAGAADQPGPGPGTLKIRFGIAPANYAEGGDGVGVGEVFDGTSAAEAGIKSGDRLTRWNGEPIADVQDWMGFLRKHKPGDIVDVTVVRPLNASEKNSPTEELVVRVTLKARDQAAR